MMDAIVAVTNAREAKPRSMSPTPRIRPAAVDGTRSP
jgi:hypothetical protein